MSQMTSPVQWCVIFGALPLFLFSGSCTSNIRCAHATPTPRLKRVRECHARVFLQIEAAIVASENSEWPGILKLLRARPLKYYSSSPAVDIIYIRSVYKHLETCSMHRPCWLCYRSPTALCTKRNNFNKSVLTWCAEDDLKTCVTCSKSVLCERQLQ